MASIEAPYSFLIGEHNDTTLRTVSEAHTHFACDCFMSWGLFHTHYAHVRILTYPLSLQFRR